MMKIFRATNSSVLGMIKDDLIETRTEWYGVMMREHPDNVCVVVIVDGSKVVGHIVARLVEDIVSGERLVWLDSAKNDVDGMFGMEAFDTFVDWCKSAGVHHIRAEVKRNLAAMHKVYGFNEYAVVIDKEI